MKFELNAQARTLQGSGASRRLRRAGKVPGIIYGGDVPAANPGNCAQGRVRANPCFGSEPRALNCGKHTGIPPRMAERPSNSALGLR